jgi:hypothetical protein
MKPLNIDFVVRPPWQQPLATRSRAILIALGGVAVLAAAALAWQALQLERQLAESARRRSPGRPGNCRADAAAATAAASCPPRRCWPSTVPSGN